MYEREEYGRTTKLNEKCATSIYTQYIFPAQTWNNILIKNARRNLFYVIGIGKFDYSTSLFHEKFYERNIQIEHNTCTKYENIEKNQNK